MQLRRDSSLSTWALGSGMSIALVSLYLLPLTMAAALHAWQLSERQTAWLGTIEVAGVALAALLLSPRAARLTAGNAWAAALLLVGVNLLSAAMQPGFLAAALLRGAGGIGAGVVMAVVTARVSATADPEAAYGKAYGAMSFAFAVLLLGVPHLQELWGERLLFGLMAGFVLMACPGLRHLHPAAAAGTPPIAATRVAWRDVLWLSLAITLSFLLNGGVYAWSEPVAEAVGASPQLLGAALAGSMLCSAAGATLASRLGQRAGRSGPLGVCMALAGVSYALVLGAGSVATLVAGLLLYGLVTLFFTAYANGAAAAIDPQGRVATALQGYALLAYAAGPGLFSELAHVLSPRLFGALALLANLLAFALFLPVTRRLDRRPPAPGPDAAPR